MSQRLKLRLKYPFDDSNAYRQSSNLAVSSTGADMSPLLEAAGAPCEGNPMSDSTTAVNETRELQLKLTQEDAGGAKQVVSESETAPVRLSSTDQVLDASSLRKSAADGAKTTEQPNPNGIDPGEIITPENQPAQHGRVEQEIDQPRQGDADGMKTTWQLSFNDIKPAQITTPKSQLAQHGTVGQEPIQPITVTLFPGHITDMLAAEGKAFNESFNPMPAQEQDFALGQQKRLDLSGLPSGSEASSFGLFPSEQTAMFDQHLMAKPAHGYQMDFPGVNTQDYAQPEYPPNLPLVPSKRKDIDPPVIEISSDDASSDDERNRSSDDEPLMARMQPSHSPSPVKDEAPEAGSEHATSDSRFSWKLPTFAVDLQSLDPKTEVPSLKVSVPNLVLETVLLHPDYAAEESRLFMEVFLPGQQALENPDPAPAQAVLNFHTICVMVLDAFTAYEFGDIISAPRGSPAEVAPMYDAQDADVDEIFFAVLDRWRVGRVRGERKSYALIRGIQEFYEVAGDIIFYIKEHGRLRETPKKERKVRNDKGKKRGPRGDASDVEETPTKGKARKANELTPRKKAKSDTKANELTPGEKAKAATNVNILTQRKRQKVEEKGKGKEKEKAKGGSKAKPRAPKGRAAPKTERNEKVLVLPRKK